MPVPSLPKLGTPPAPPPLVKSGLRNTSATPVVFMRDSEGRFETRKEAISWPSRAGILRGCAERLLDFDTTRLQAMDEAGVDKVLLSFVPGFAPSACRASPTRPRPRTPPA